MRHLRYLGLLALCLLIAGCFDNNSNTTVPESGLQTISSAACSAVITWICPATTTRPLHPGP